MSRQESAEVGGRGGEEGEGGPGIVYMPFVVCSYTNPDTFYHTCFVTYVKSTIDTFTFCQPEAHNKDDFV